jgi:hypothetical protein
VISNSYRKLPTPLFNIIIIKSDFLYRGTPFILSLHCVALEMIV